VVFSLWSATAAQEGSAKVSFELLSRLGKGEYAGGLDAENFVGYVDTLNAFADVVNDREKKSQDGAGYVVLDW
jgi:hypothetical protein